MESPVNPLVVARTQNIGILTTSLQVGTKNTCIKVTAEICEKNGRIKSIYLHINNIFPFTK